MDIKTKIVPLLPIEKVVLFPRALLSIQIPSQRTMMGLGDYLVQDAELCFGVPRKSDNKKSSSITRTRDVYRHACIGRIVNKEVDSKNEYKFLVEGIERVAIIEEVRTKPVVLVKVEVLHDFLDLSRKSEVNEEMRHVVKLSRRLGGMLNHLNPIIKSILAAYPHPAIIADLITYTFIKTPYDKLSILEELDTLRRLKLVRVQLQNIFHRLSRQRNRDRLR